MSKKTFTEGKHIGVLPSDVDVDYLLWAVDTNCDKGNIYKLSLEYLEECWESWEDNPYNYITGQTPEELTEAILRFRGAPEISIFTQEKIHFSAFAKWSKAAKRTNPRMAPYVVTQAIGCIVSAPIGEEWDNYNKYMVSKLPKKIPEYTGVNVDVNKYGITDNVLVVDGRLTIVGNLTLSNRLKLLGQAAISEYHHAWILDFENNCVYKVNFTDEDKAIWLNSAQIDQGALEDTYYPQLLQRMMRKLPLKHPLGRKKNNWPAGMSVQTTSAYALYMMYMNDKIQKPGLINSRAFKKRMLSLDVVYCTYKKITESVLIAADPVIENPNNPLAEIAAGEKYLKDHSNLEKATANAIEVAKVLKEQLITYKSIKLRIENLKLEWL